MIRPGALKRNFVQLHSTINGDSPLSLCAFSHPDEAVFKAIRFWAPGNEWRTDNQTDGGSSYSEGDRHMAVCPFREKL